MNKPGTTVLDSAAIYKAGNISDKILKIVTNNMAQVTKFILQKCTKISDFGLGCIPPKHNMTYLDLSREFFFGLTDAYYF